jgi:NTE family protein
MSTATAPTSELAERIELLAQVPLFSTFSEAELAWLAPLFEEASHPKGHVLFNEGDEGGDFLVVARGELEVLAGGAMPRVVNRLGRGDHLGEMALLLGGRRTATVRVSRAARLLTMSEAGFHELLEHNPKVLGFIAQNLSRQLDARTRGEIAARRTLTVGVSGAPDLEGKTLVSNALAALLATETGLPVLIIDASPEAGVGLEDVAEPDGGLGSLEIGPQSAARLTLAKRATPAWPSAKTLDALIERAHSRFPLVVLDLGSHDAVRPRLLSELCDVVVDVVATAETDVPKEYGGSMRVLRIVNLHNQVSRAFPVSSCEPFLLREDPVLRRLEPLEQAARIRTQPRSPAAPALHRLARKVRGASTGVALAGGAAFGLAHIGVLRVLEDAGIPIDMVTGTSMGSIVGAMYATGLSAHELTDVTIKTATRRKALSAVDLTLARPGLLAGNRLIAILGELGVKGCFEDLVLPYQAMTTDVEVGERVPIGTGAVAAACRASASIPGVFAPVRRDGRILVDGGVVDQVPAALLRDMGADVCLAVTVIPTLRRGVQTPITRISNELNALNPLSYIAHARGMPALVDIVINAIHMLQYQLGSYEAMSADAQLEVDTSDFTWVDFDRAADLIERGAQTAEQALPRLRQILAERPVLCG